MARGRTRSETTVNQGDPRPNIYVWDSSEEEEEIPDSDSDMWIPPMISDAKEVSSTVGSNIQTRTPEGIQEEPIPAMPITTVCAAVAGTDMETNQDSLMISIPRLEVQWDIL